MQYYPIGEYVNLGGVPVPKIVGGARYLDWRRIKGTRAPLLHGPYGPGHFKIGGRLDTEQVVLDYAMLPDRNFVVEMIAPESTRFHCEDAYSVFLRDGIMTEVHYKLTKIINRLEELGITHDADLHGSDQWYFMRAIGKEAKARLSSLCDFRT